MFRRIAFYLSGVLFVVFFCLTIFGPLFRPVGWTSTFLVLTIVFGAYYVLQTKGFHTFVSFVQRHTTSD